MTISAPCHLVSEVVERKGWCMYQEMEKSIMTEDWTKKCEATDPSEHCALYKLSSIYLQHIVNRPR